ncbi:MAG: GGDEF domain-containing protein [Burkholderiales bacterium]|nr:GGDEF domain-containing protein [Burkholderiales bacterium]
MQKTFLQLPLAKKLLRQNLLVLTAGVFSALALCTLLSIYLTQQDLRSKTSYQAATLAGNLADDMAHGDLRSMQSLLLNASNGSDLESVTVYDQGGRAILAWTAQGQLIDAKGIEDSPPIRVAQTALQLRQLIAAAPVVSAAAITGKVQLHTSTWTIYRHALLTLLYGAIGAALIAALTTYLLTQQQLLSLSPVFELSLLADQVATLGDYSLRAKHDEQHELGSLNMHFNLMLARMEAWENDMHSEARERREAENRMAILNNHDSLTKLPNRHYFHRLLTNCVEDAVACQELAALMFIDLDSFKTLNEVFGYDAGDLILSTMANRLCGVLRNTDTLCRVDGDEFAAILPRVGNPEVAQQLAERLVQAIRQPMLLRGQELAVTASIGIACCPVHAREQRLFLHDTDLALRAAKAAGRNSWQMFSPKILPDAQTLA